SGLRFNLEFYRIEQSNAIGTLAAQVMVSQEASFPGRVIRDGSGAITLLDLSAVNLYRRDTEGWDLSADYAVPIGNGRIVLRAAESAIWQLKTQYSLTAPEYDAIDFPSEGGAAKYKSNYSLAWESGRFTAEWTARYFSSYKQFGAVGG